ncbi:methyl-accepting chemotaxis protein [Desulfitobacterium metallireducens]|uniref:Signal protein n=1 Tax=Desulfitobacterium metallireducens DSM 15288 TaxID=871968 RepID=W0EA41_9FIRM|nr:methyl-accepting chemotaxis protein [Desulfitobacterium metallireducens]AHF06393.1 signal protein [Desulfitobacterium metallireducens DSM 15288]
MNGFRNWKIRTKILSLVILMGLFTGVVGFVGYYYISKANTEMADMYSNSLMSIKYINDARAQDGAGESAFFHYLLAQDKNTQQQQQNEIKTRSDNFDKSYNSYLKLATDPSEKEILPKLEKELETYKTERQKAMDMANQGETKGAYDYFTNNAQTHLDAINTTLQELADFNATHADEVNTQNDAENAVANKIIMTLSTVAVLLGLVLGYLMATMIASSIKQVLLEVERIANGDLTVEDIIVKSKDEVGQLATHFNVMKGHLDALVKHVAQSSEQVASSSEELTAMVDQSTQAANQIAKAIEGVAKGTEKEAGAIDETSSAIQQISAGTQETAASSSEIAESMTNTLATTQDGQKALDRVVEQMNSISGGTENVQHRITELSSSSEKISNIVQFITEIADQTNLLALNAAIEAARAGEHGRGFAVVAEEVRKLAEQSREATTQISALINQNNSNIDLAVTAMETEVKNVADGIEVVNVAGRSFREIAQMIENVSAQVEEISSTIQQIASGSQQILTSAEKIDKLSKETSSHAQVVSAGVQEQAASMEQIDSASQSLATLAQELQNTISKFTV